MVLGIALGVALHVATESASESMFSAFGEFVERVAGRADLTVESTSVGVPTELVGEVMEVPGVAHAAATMELTVQAPELGESLLIFGVDMLGDMHFLPFDAAEGEEQVIDDPLSFVNDPTALLLSRKFATRHGLATDSTLTLLTSAGPKVFTVRGLLEDSGPASSFGGQVAVMFMDAAQVAFEKGTFADRIDLALEKDANESRVIDAVVAVVGDGYTIESPAAMGSRLREMVAPLHGALWLSGFLALLVGGFLVYNAVGVAVAQRRREIGMLRAFGVTKRATVALFCGEAAMLSIPGIALGLWMGASLAEYSTDHAMRSLNRLYFTAPDVESHLSLRLVCISAAAGLITAVLAAFLPARKGAAIDPAMTLRGSASVEAKAVPVRTLAVIGALMAASAWIPGLQGSRLGNAASVTVSLLGTACLTPLLIQVIRRLSLKPTERLLGIPGRLGLDYVERSLARSSINVLALMVAVSMSVSVGGWLASFEHSIVQWADRVGVADLSVTQGSPIIDRQHVPFTASVVEQVGKVSGVSAVQPYRMIDQDIGDVGIKLVATDTETFRTESEKRGKGWTLLSGAALEAGELRSQALALLSENAAERLKKQVGDTVELVTPNGMLEMTVRGVIVDYTSETGAVFIDRSLYLSHYGDGAVDGLSVFIEESANVDATASAIRDTLGGSSGVFVTRTETVRSQIISTIRDTFSYSRSVEWVTLLIALMGVVGTMIATIIDRSREIGMLRAIGASTGQVAASIVVEAGFLGVCATVIGIAVGILQCQLFLNTLLVDQTGFHLQFVFPAESAARIGILAIVTSAAAGGLPALRAAKTNVASAMVYD